MHFKANVNLLVLIASWTSLFVLSWLMILRTIPRTDMFIWGFFIGFLVTAFFSAVYKDVKR